MNEFVRSQWFSCSDISLMNQQQSAISLRRQTFHKQIRNRQLSDYFSKRRLELIHSSPSNLSDEFRLEQILKTINNFCIERYKEIIVRLMKIDASHSIFYELTGFNPETPPSIFRSIVKGVLCENKETLIWEELGTEHEYSLQQRNELFGIYRELESELERRSLHFIEITNLIRTIQDMNLLCKEEIIVFLSFILNLYHLLKRFKELLHIQQKSNKLVGQQSPVNYQAETSLMLLQNILTADDSLLEPILPEFIELNGCNPDNLGLFYNLFLIRCHNKAVRCKLFNYFIRLLENNRQFFLQQHRVIIATFNAAIQKSDDLRIKPDQHNFQILEERIIRLLGELLKVLNMRYECSMMPFIESKTEDYIFISNLMKIFMVFSGQTQLIRCMMEDRGICIFLLNRLVYSELEKEAQIFQFCLNILSRAVRDHYSLHYFINQEPRFMIKIMSLFDKFLQPNFIRLQQYQQLANLQYLIYVINDLSSNSRGVQILIQRNIHFKITKIYYSMPGNSKAQRQIKLSCEMIYLNILSALRKHPNSPQLFFHQLFTNQYVNYATNEATTGCYFMLMNLLKYSSNKQKNLELRTALTIITYVSESCFQCKEFATARQMLLSETIIAQLRQLLNCPDQKIVALAERVIEGIEDLRKIKSYNHSVQYYEQQI